MGMKAWKWKQFHAFIRRKSVVENQMVKDVELKWGLGYHRDLRGLRQGIGLSRQLLCMTVTFYLVDQNTTQILNL